MNAAHFRGSHEGNHPPVTSASERMPDPRKASMQFKPIDATCYIRSWRQIVGGSDISLTTNPYLETLVARRVPQRL